jgi:hypothetical protein
MAAWLVGKHRFDFNGVEAAIEVVKIRATVAQPLGAWLDWGFNNTGQWSKGAEGRNAPVLVIDQGFNTLDLFAVENGRPSERYTAGEALGMARAAEMFISNIERRYGVSLGLHEADWQLRRLLDGEAAMVYAHGEPVDVSAEINQAINGLAADVLQFIRQRVRKDAGKFRIILTGGGAVALASRLIKEFPHAELAPAPAMANARGLAKLAISGYLG